MPYMFHMINRRDLLKEIRRRAKLRGLAVHVDEKSGKGSHGKVYVGNRRTVLPKKASPALAKAIMKQLDLED